MQNDERLRSLLGLHQDLVLEMYGRPYRITIAGRDVNGLVVNWHYKEFRLTFCRVIGEEPIHKKIVSVYVVTNVFLKGE